MKRQFFAFLFSVMVSVIACQKETTTTSNALIASKTTAIKRGEPIVFTLATNRKVDWLVSPSAGVQINATGNQASIRFANAGQYMIEAIAETTTASHAVTVTDSIYAGNDTLSNGQDTANGMHTVTGDTLRFSNGELLQLTPAVVVDDSSGASGFWITATTTNSYDCKANSLLSRIDTSGNQYQIDYLGVYVPDSCSSGQRPVSFQSPVFYPAADGSYVFRVVADGKTYTGAFTKQGRTYTFTWPYSSGVTLAPLVVQ